ncbi:peptidylprolyl isomerase [Vibrio spartinae]|uniref:Periplasmic chaperone PpiD n=1 Tax=Vibrio spartinae TaxID=1918945 RepID=A0A1N6M767_9VIBR|nr:peptidylprolyl isomerase [Vibrio spartinae]QMV14026.1 Peptidyl-prolyl cis-trans isomerase D [Vibrio spartinae]SIO95293.1 Peptidyl-prolyl cis-trans isomerase D [Vibrio spartinae]
MMDRLREGVNSIAIKIILGLIILSFVFAGVSSYLVGGGNDAAAKVGGTKISRAEFEQAYQNERNRMQSQLGDYFSNLLADPSYVASFRRSVLDKMVNDVLLEQHAEALGLRISDKQVRQAIVDMPQFQSDGKFDQDIYQTALRRAGFSPDSFAAFLRSDLVRNQLLAAVQSSDFTLDGEVDAQATLFAQKREIRTITLATDDYAKKIQLSDDDLNAYYKSHEDNFMRPEQFKISYLELSADKLKSSIKVTDDEAEKYYQDHADQYSIKAQRKVSHILVNDEKQADALLKQLKEGTDFSKLAKEDSQDPGSASKGGELDWFEKGVMDPAFEKAAFALKKVGDLSGVVKSNFGYHIIKLDAMKPAQVKPFSEVKDDVIASIRDERALDRFYQLQNDLEKVAFESPDSLDEAAKTVQEKVHTTDFVSLTDLPEILRAAPVQKALDNPEVKNEGLNSSVVEVAPEDVVVVRIEERRPETLLPFDTVKAQVVEALSKVKAEQQTEAIAEKVLAGLKQGDMTALEKNQLKFGELTMIDRRSPLARSVFAMQKPQEGQPVYGQTKDRQGSIVLVELTKIESTTDKQLTQQLAVQMQRLTRQQDLTGLLKILREQTDIEYYLAAQ